ncbi:hypothetical protein Tco_0477572 [Tanacetum coccineum]
MNFLTHTASLEASKWQQNIRLCRFFFFFEFGDLIVVENALLGTIPINNTSILNEHLSSLRLENVLNSSPVKITWILLESACYVLSERNIRASTSHSIHNRTHSRGIWNILHALQLSRCRGTL